MAISAVLLAGGESRRMGRDKATLVWRGRPLWEWQIEKLRELRPCRILLSAKSDLPWRPADVDLVLDVTPSRGPLSGLAAALNSMETQHLLALAVDMPFVTTLQLRGLCDCVADGIGVIPMIHKRAEPLCAIYPKEARAIFAETLQGNNFSLQPIVTKLIALNMLHVMPVLGKECELYKSINELADLE